MRSQQLKAEETREGENTRESYLRRSVGLDEEEHPSQQDTPAALDHLVVVQVGTLTGTTREHQENQLASRFRTRNDPVSRSTPCQPGGANKS